MIEDKTPNKTSLAELGEFGLIKHLTEHFKISQESTIVGVGDDAAVLDHSGLKTLVTTDIYFVGN